MRRLLPLMILLPGLVWANPFKESLTDAAESIEDASSAAKRAGGSCKGILPSLDQSVEDIDSIRRGTTERRMNQIQSFVNGLQAASAQAGCPRKVAERISRAVVALNNARSMMEDDDDRRDRRHHHRDDDDEDENRRQPPAPPPPPPGRAVEITLGELRVIYGERVNGEGGVKVVLGASSLRGLGRAPFSFGGRVRMEDGSWSEWLTSQQYMAPQDPYQAPEYVQWFPAHLLRGGSGNGHFLARISLLDRNRSELAFREVPIDLVGAPAPTPMAPRDCGTGQDPGCSMQRAAHWAMDGETFSGFYQSQKSTSSDLARADMCRSVLGNNWITAKQLGMLLELFNSDLVRLDVAKVAAPHTVNPQHALGLTSKFRSSLLQRDFTALMSQQR
jgi:hypothetical protein